MKEITGYLIDRVTGAGISGKNVSFKKLDGTPVSVADTLWQQVSGATDATGRFSARFELSPGPVNVQVDVSGSEKKVRKFDEKAQMSLSWSNDISRIARGVGNGVVGGFMNELAVSAGSGHVVTIGTGAAIFNGGVFSIEANPVPLTIPENTNPALTPRIDLITLRQYNESAAGQLSGKQEIIVTQGVVSAQAPVTPTGANFVDFPLATVSTAYGSATTSPGKDLRAKTLATSPPKDFTPKYGYAANNYNIYNNSVQDNYEWRVNIGPVTVSDLDPSAIYDGEMVVSIDVNVEPTVSVSTFLHLYLENMYQDLAPDSWIEYITGDNYYPNPQTAKGSPVHTHRVMREGDANSIGMHTTLPAIWVLRLHGLTGQSSRTWNPTLSIRPGSNNSANVFFYSVESREVSVVLRRRP